MEPTEKNVQQQCSLDLPEVHLGIEYCGKKGQTRSLSAVFAGTYDRSHLQFEFENDQIGIIHSMPNDRFAVSFRDNNYMRAHVPICVLTYAGQAIALVYLYHRKSKKAATKLQGQLPPLFQFADGTHLEIKLPIIRRRGYKVGSILSAAKLVEYVQALQDYCTFREMVLAAQPRAGPAEFYGPQVGADDDALVDLGVVANWSESHVPDTLALCKFNDTN